MSIQKPILNLNPFGDGGEVLTHGKEIPINNYILICGALIFNEEFDLIGILVLNKEWLKWLPIPKAFWYKDKIAWLQNRRLVCGRSKTYF